eukprot:g23845.t1
MLGKLKGGKVDKSPRTDGLHPRILKQVAKDIVEALVVIFQESLESGRLPEDRRKANVTPLLKKGERQTTGNYSLVSLTSANAKILESIIKDKVAEYLEVHGKRGLSQHCYNKGRLYLTNLLEFFEEVMSKFDKGEPVDVIHLDFWEAFNKVPHRRLLNK